MAQQKLPAEPEHVSCEVCLKEVPRSEAASVEATDYVAHFCGLDCYEMWRRERQLNRESQAEAAGDPRRR